MYGNKMVKRVRDDQYYKNKDKINEQKKMMGDFLEVVPVDMYGNTVTEGKSAADKSKNMKRIATDIQKRVGC